MKYLIILILFFLTGCNDKEINIKNVKNIKYNDINFLENDFNYILKNVNGKYYETNKIEDNTSTIEIVDDNSINTFYITKNKIYTNIKDKLYYKDNSDFLSILDTLYINYTNTNFLSITYNNTFIYDENKYNIKLDNTNNNYEIILTDTVYDFKIHKIVGNDTVDLLYNIDVLDNKDIVIRTNNDIEISFKNKYNFLVTINKNNENFVTNVSQSK